MLTGKNLFLSAGGRVGLFGGSFNPAHSGHLGVADVARRACRLDRVVWLVNPASPLKQAGDYLPLAERLDRARALTAGRPWLTVSDAEARLGTRYTADTIAALRERAPATRMVWIMGADSLASFHRWRDWRGIAASVPMLVVSRPGEGRAALTSLAARTFAESRVPASEAHRLPDASPPAWAYLPALHDPASATAIRARR